MVAEVHPSLDAAFRVSSSKPRGADIVAANLDRLNNKFQQLLATLRASLKDYAARNPQDKEIAVSLFFFLKFSSEKDLVALSGK